MDISKYNNKKFSILGDSISTFEGVSIPKEASFYDTGRKLTSGVLTASQTWWGQVIERLGANLLVNNSIAGSTVTWHPHYEIQSYGCSDERTSALDKDGISPDVIIIFMGTNDWGLGRVIVDDKNTEQQGELTIFSNAYHAMLTKLRKNYPQAEIWCLTLGRSFCSANPDFVYPYYFGGFHTAEYCKAIALCAEEHDCKWIDLFHNAQSYDTIDGFHPNDEGMKTIADAVMACLGNKQ